MNTRSFDAFKILLCKLALGASALFAATVVLAMVQGAASLCSGTALLLLSLLAINTLCGLLAPAPRTRDRRLYRVRRGDAAVHRAA